MDEAVEAYQGALRLYSDHAAARLGKGATLHDLGRPGEALASLDTALALEPANALAHSKWGRGLAGPHAPRRGLGQFR